MLTGTVMMQQKVYVVVNATYVGIGVIKDIVGNLDGNKTYAVRMQNGHIFYVEETDLYDNKSTLLDDMVTARESAQDGLTRKYTVAKYDALLNKVRDAEAI